MGYQASVRKIQPQPVLSIRELVPFAQLEDKLGAFVAEVAGHLQQAGVRPAGPPFSRYHGVEGDKVDLEAGLPVPRPLPEAGRIKPGELPGGEVVSTTHVGAYDQLPQAGAALDGWLEKHGRKAAGPNWELYHVAPGHKADPASWKTEVVKPLQ